jgi:DNA-binding IscR family transcriptional regulator
MKTNSVSSVLAFSLLEVEEMHKKHVRDLARCQNISRSYLDQIILLESELADTRAECEHYKGILQDFNCP